MKSCWSIIRRLRALCSVSLCTRPPPSLLGHSAGDGGLVVLAMRLRDSATAVTDARQTAPEPPYACAGHVAPRGSGAVWGPERARRRAGCPCIGRPTLARKPPRLGPTWTEDSHTRLPVETLRDTVGFVRDAGPPERFGQIGRGRGNSDRPRAKSLADIEHSWGALGRNRPDLGQSWPGLAPIIFRIWPRWG